MEVLLLPSSTYPDNGAFNIVSGDLVTAHWLDYEQQSSYSVHLRAYDAAGKTYDKTMVISVTDVDETPRMAKPSQTVSGGMVLRWQSFANNRYRVMTATNLMQSFVPVATNLPATPPQNSYTGSMDNAVIRFWRIKME